MAGWKQASSSSIRTRSWDLVLEGKRTALTRALPVKRFRAVTAHVSLHAVSDDAPFTRFTVTLKGTRNRAVVPTASWDNTTPDTRWCIRSSPAWVRELFAEVTAHGHLVNTYEGPAWAAAAVAGVWPYDPAYPAPGGLEAAA